MKNYIYIQQNKSEYIFYEQCIVEKSMNNIKIIIVQFNAYSLYKTLLFFDGWKKSRGKIT